MGEKKPTKQTNQTGDIDSLTSFHIIKECGQERAQGKKYSITVYVGRNGITVKSR